MGRFWGAQKWTRPSKRRIAARSKRNLWRLVGKSITKHWLVRQDGSRLGSRFGPEALGKTPSDEQPWGYFRHNWPLVHSETRIAGFVPVAATAGPGFRPHGSRQRKCLDPTREKPVIHKKQPCLLLRLCIDKDIKEKTVKQPGGSTARGVGIRRRGLAEQEAAQQVWQGVGVDPERRPRSAARQGLACGLCPQRGS
ncbi:hypothetical protein SAMN05192589_10498 [Paracidovorax valerianellae]|uniref:Uncharacterized protein n=1 Tax=Paracidovorax valerianellae TaxID=187868 RepID=A0A1G6RC67_9BURK|nr:hypothetical protein SAMN05192589_10498 [Paracidovorax valerianellae]